MPPSIPGGRKEDPGKQLLLVTEGTLLPDMLLIRTAQPGHRGHREPWGKSLAKGTVFS